MDSKLAINARFRHRRITGVERYAREISNRLQLQKRFIEPTRPLGRIAGHLWEQFVLPTLVQKDEILWSPANTSAWSVSHQVVTIHDASVFDHPEWFNPTFVAWTRLSWKVLTGKAKAIITVSNFSRERLKYHLGVSEGKIQVVYNGVGKPFEPQSQKAIEEVKTKYNLDRPYFLFVGTLEPRKNLTALLQAWQILNLDTHELFIAGAEGGVFASVGQIDTLTCIPDGHAWSRYASLPDHRSVTYVSDEDLPALYSGAAAFVFPSLYEGFGLPVLEAMACGTPVITSNTTAFPEIFEDAALLVNPLDPKETANAMQRLIEDQTLALKMCERGLQKAEEFTWEKSAIRTQEILEKAGDSHL